jgi:hypothetical protein
VSIWCRRPQGPLFRVCGVSMDAYFHGASSDTISSCVRFWRCEILLLQLNVILAASGTSDHGFMVSIDASFYGGSNDALGVCV